MDESAKRDLNSRLERAGWALFLIMIGGLGLVSPDVVPEGTWLVGVGLIMLGLNAARRYYGIEPSTFTVILGVIALATGLSDFLGVDLPWLPILLILIGANLLYRTATDEGRRRG